MDPISPSMPPLEDAPFATISQPIHPIELNSDHEVHNPPPIPPPDINRSNDILTNHSSLFPYESCSQIGKDKEILISHTPVNSPNSSPTNSIGSDLDLFLSKKLLELKALTIHKPGSKESPFISPKSASNIIVRRKNGRGSRHFRGRGESAGRGFRNLSLIDVPIVDMNDERPLRACKAEKLPNDIYDINEHSGAGGGEIFFGVKIFVHIC